MQDASHSLFALMDSEEEDFPTLVARYGIDPATDLQYSDLSNVDFGELVAETLNLTGSNITGANLSRIRCKNVIGAERSADDKFDTLARMFHSVTFSIEYYQNKDWAWSQASHIEGDEEAEAPDLAIYDSVAQQDGLTQRLWDVFSASAKLRRDPRNLRLPSINVLCFYARNDDSKFEFDPISLDNNFLNLIAKEKTHHFKFATADKPFQTSLVTANQYSVQSIERGVEGIELNERRMSFARAINRELTPGPKHAPFDRAVILFSGYPPISRELFQHLCRVCKLKLKFVFLCPSRLSYQLIDSMGRRQENVVVPDYRIREPLATKEDLARLERRISTSSDSRILIGSVTLAKLDQMVGQPLRVIKDELLKRMSDVRVADQLCAPKFYFQ
jgi:hypothetical protein